MLTRYCSSNVTKLVKIHIRGIQILTFRICQMRMRMQKEEFILSVGTYNALV